MSREQRAENKEQMCLKSASMRILSKALETAASMTLEWERGKNEKGI